MVVHPTPLPGCYEIHTDPRRDNRGVFVKTVQSEEFYRYGLETDFVEQYYTVSRAGVLRGMHFQLPPYDHAKLVFCIDGRATDVVLDLRVGSPTYGTCHMLTLSAEEGNMIYIPRGLAHGFCAPHTPVTMVYNTTSAHAPRYDTGVRWDSAGIEWPIEQPLLSERDCALPPLASFSSPFQFDLVTA